MRTEHNNTGAAFLDIDLSCLESVLAEPDEEPVELVSLSTKDKRKRYQQLWNDTWTMAKLDPEQVWLDLCQPGHRQTRAVELCKKFLKVYALNRKRRQVCLGPEEYKVVRIVTSADTVLTAWYALVSGFDTTLLARKRAENPMNAFQWSLMYGNGWQISRRTGPIHEVRKWIEASAEELGLSRDQSFVKREATAADIILLIRTIYTRAQDIPCAVDARIAFHFVLILSGLTGTRPGALQQVRYKDVDLVLVLDTSSQETRLVAYFTLYRNKEKTGTIHRDQSHILKIPIVLGKKTTLCPVSLVVARALADDAFATPIDSFHTLLSRPVFEQNRRLELKWKENILQKPIFPITYKQIDTLWLRTTLVAGFPERIRPYSMRVGAGNRLDGALTPALRNYVLWNSSAIFQQSYQTRQIRQNLMPILDPDSNAETELFESLRQLSLDCDDRAPIYVNQSDIDGWERTRKDLAECLQRKDKKKHYQIIKSLSDLLITQRRREFFDIVADLRARGQSTDSLAIPQEAPSRRSIYAGQAPAAKEVASLLSTTDVSFNQIASYIERLVVFQVQGLNTCPPAKEKLGDEDISRRGLNLQEYATMPIIEPPQQECILCQKPWNYQTSLSKHYNRVHKETLSGPFRCPVCQDEQIINGWNEWALHIASRHGCHNAPRRRPMAAGLLTCFLCGDKFMTVSGLTKHTSISHEEDFETPKSCPECSHPEDKTPKICSLSEWCKHVELFHGGPGCAPSVPLGLKVRCLICDKNVVHERNHYRNHHVVIFDKAFPCPECTRQGSAVLPLISSCEDWELHCAAVHGKTTRIFGQSQRARCLVCDDYYARVADHFTKDHLRLFPFHCKECERLEGICRCV